MKPRREEKTETQEESARGDARPAGRAGAQPSQTACEPGERAQGRAGQKPQEDARGAAQCAAAAARTPQGNLNIAMARISSSLRRFRYWPGIWRAALYRVGAGGKTSRMILENNHTTRTRNYSTLPRLLLIQRPFSSRYAISSTVLRTIKRLRSCSSCMCRTSSRARNG
jgi:hypothetical protein